MPDMNRSVKGSVFTFLFKQPEYTRQLYLALHPEDTGVKESDLKLVTLENVLSTGLYNDLGIQVRDQLILLVEAQSTFSINIALRMLLYLAGTYKTYIEEQKLDLYSSHPVEIPRPELYVVYTGGRKEVPEILRLLKIGLIVNPAVRCLLAVVGNPAQLLPVGPDYGQLLTQLLPVIQRFV